jgi:hypothetical protein
MTRELVTRKIDWREIGSLLTIAAATSFITLGVLECLFNNIRCVQVISHSAKTVIQDVRSCSNDGGDVDDTPALLRSRLGP